MRKLIASIAGRKRCHRKIVKLLPKDAVERDRVALEVEVDSQETTSIIRFVPLEGWSNLAAVAIAAGHERREVAEMLHMELEELNSVVTPDKVSAARKNMHKLITDLADAKVARDLIQGVVTEETSRADMISSRRKKLLLDAMDEWRKEEAESQRLQEERERRTAKRFGVDRLGKGREEKA